MEDTKSWRKGGSFFDSVKHAWHGMKFGWAAERNMKAQAAVFVIALLVGWALRLPTSQIALIVIVSGLVLALELVNTAIEEMGNVVSPEYNDRLRQVKDIAAGAVLLASLAAILVGLIIFLPAIL